MKTKLTLSLEHEIIKKGKTYASRQNLSLSNLLERLLRKELQKDEVSFVEKWDSVFSKIRGKTDEELKAIRYKHIKRKHIQ
jgi:hypothetical protein